MIKEKSPCRGCTERKPTCHGWCGMYLDWKKKADEQLEAERKAREDYYRGGSSRCKNALKALKEKQRKARGGH